MKPDYKSMYHSLFNDVTDIIDELETLKCVIERLKEAQIKSEEIYINEVESSETQKDDDVIIYNFKERKVK